MTCEKWRYLVKPLMIFTVRTRATSFIRGLFVHRRPSAVARFVMAVIVYAVECVCSGRALAHISHEIKKIIPPITKSNSASLVRFKQFRDVAKASTAHRYPSSVCESLVSTSAVSVPDSTLVYATNIFDSSTAAACSGTTSQVLSKYFCRLAALALTSITRLPVNARSWLYNCQSSKLRSSRSWSAFPVFSHV